jgi:hypothetical protein
VESDRFVLASDLAQAVEVVLKEASH